MDVYLVDGTYELFRHHFGRPRRASAEGAEVAAVRGVLLSVLAMLEQGVTHLGVATDHVVESFRNDLWPGYKTSAGVPAELLAQFPLLEEALKAMGVRVWAMTDLEADDALASAAAVAGGDRRVGQVFICTPDKDLAQCVRDRRVVQLDRRAGTVVDEEGVRAKFGVAPASIPDWLALVGDSADGFPGLPGWGKRSASAVLARYGSLEHIPDEPSAWDPELRRRLRGADALAAALAAGRQAALLFRQLATLRIDAALLGDVAELAWEGPTGAFEDVAGLLRDERLAERAHAAAARR